MKIERLELIGYKRLMLSNIHTLVYTPTALYQLILGTNGCGKSSLLAELSPLPGHASNYTKDGAKIVTISHRGSTYVLTSTFKSGNKHSFVKDGETLNKDGTALVQKELVRQEFNGYNAELHDLLTGRTKFTRMAALKRRDWITLLSKADYRYAMRKYGEFKSAARDSQGALKHIQKRLTHETNNLKALSGLEGLDGRANQLREELSCLLTARTPQLPAYQELRRQLDDALSDTEELAREVATLVVPQPRGSSFQSLDNVRQYVSALDSEVNTTQALLNHFTREYSDIESIVSSLSADEEVTPENLTQLIESLEGQIQVLAGQYELFSDWVEPLAIKRESDHVVSQVIELFNQLPDNTDRRYSRDRAQRAKEEMRVDQTAMDKATAKLSQIQARLTVIHNAKDTTCPDCGYVWREGYSEAEVAQNEQWQDEHTQNFDHAHQHVKKLETYLEEVDQCTGLYNQFRGLVSAYPRLKLLWDYILDLKLLTDEPKSRLDIFYLWQRDLERAVAHASLQQRLDTLLQLAAKQGGEGGHFNQRLLKLHGEISTTTVSLQTLRGEARSFKSYHERLVKLEERTRRLQDRQADVERLTERSVDAYRNHEIDQIVTMDQNELATIQWQLTEKATLEGVVNELASSQDDVELDHLMWSLMTRAMSPNDGLIAEQLSGSIGCIADQLNSIIATVWTYDMIIQPCGLESGELDYKFPLHVGSTGQVVSDIGEASEGQIQMIDFAFQLTVMLYLGLTDFPLYCDELGSKFDPQHRQNLIGFIKQLVDTNHHSQLFMVSHYVASHGSYVNAEILVLDSSNVAVPGEYNKHVVLG